MAIYGAPVPWALVGFLSVVVALPAVAEPAALLTGVPPVSQQARDLFAQAPAPPLPSTPEVRPLEGFAESRLDQPLFAPFRREGTVRESSRAAYVVTRRQIEVQGARTVQEALRYLPGVLSDGTAGTQLGASSSQFIRGGDSPQTLVLLDGRPINDLGFQGSYDLSEITTDAIERIEVVPGGGSTLYGANAVGGVINIVTRAVSEQPATTSVRLTAGSFGLNEQSLQTSGTSGPIGWRVGYDRTQATNNFPFTIDSVGFSGIRQNADVVYNNFNVRLEAALSPRTDLTFNLIANNKDLGAPGGVPLPIPGSVGQFNSLSSDARQFTNNWLTDLLLKAKLGQGEDSRLTARFYADFLNYRFDAPVSLGTRDEIAREDYGLQLQHDWRVSPGQNLIYGFDFRTTHALNTTFNYPSTTTALNYEGDVTQGAFFVRDEIAILDSLRLNLGVRQDLSSVVNGSFTSPSAGLRWEVGEDTAIRANYARSFRAPLVSDLYYRLRSPFFNIDGNPNLRPEQGDSYDIGIDQKIGEAALLRLTYFSNTVSDTISFVFSDPFFTSGTYTNVGLVRTTGVEATADIEIAPFWYFSANYTTSDPRILQDSDPTVLGKQLSFRGADSFNASLAYESSGGWYAGVFVHSIGSFFVNNANTESLGGYTTADLKLRLPLNNAFVLNAQLNNLFNQQYQVYPGYPGLGLNFRLGLTLTL